LLQRQRDFAAQEGGAVLDGRDIGTVIAPGAAAKLFVTASVEVRAQRRVRELLARGMPAHFDDVLLDLKARDDRDMTRSAAPLEQASDADVLDTSDLTVEESIARAIKLVEARLAYKAGSGNCATCTASRIRPRGIRSESIAGPTIQANPGAPASRSAGSSGKGAPCLLASGHVRSAVRFLH
jgi:hypothetical protein